MTETAVEAEPLPDLVDTVADEDAPESRERTRRRALMGFFWRRARGFWGPRGDRWAWWLVFALLAIILLTLGAQYGVNRWNKAIFDALEKREASTVWQMA